MPQNENSENCSENLPPWYRCSCPHMAAVLTWQLSSHGSCPHLAAVLTWQLSSPRNCSILAAVLTWQLSSPDSCSLLAAVFTWQLFYHSSCPHLAAVLTRTWQLFLLVTGSCSYSYLAAVLTRTWQLSLPLSPAQIILSAMDSGYSNWKHAFLSYQKQQQKFNVF